MQRCCSRRVALSARALASHMYARGDSEVAALEALVGRYQDELYAASSPAAGGSSRTQHLQPLPLPLTDTRVTRIEDVLLEHQRLYLSGWETRSTRAGDRPAMARPSGEPSAFDKVRVVGR